MNLITGKITLQSAHPVHDARSQALLAFVQQQGFDIRHRKNRWQASCFDREGEDVKAMLRAHGFKDCDVSLYQEYRRNFGFL